MRKKLLAILLAVVMAVSLLPTAFAADEDFFIVDDILVRYYGPGGDVIIPDRVTIIDEDAFLDCTSLTGVTIPDSVTTIGQWAFQGCTSLTSVTIPASVTSIAPRAFLLCDSLTSIDVASGNLFYSSVDGVLFNAGQTVLHTYPVGKGGVSYSIPASVTSIGDSAFDSCSSLTSVTIPDSVTTIGDWAFDDCIGLTSVTIPSSVISIGYAAFSGCSDLTSVTIPDSLTSIGDAAFGKCSGLTSVTIPDSVTTIGKWAFSWCSGLTSVTIPGGVTTIGGYAFDYCSGLTSVTIPASVITIGEWAFDDCSSLKTIYYGGSESQWKKIFSDDDYDEPLTNVTIHYNSTGPEPEEPTEPTEPEPEITFNDVPAGIWYEKSVYSGVARGLLAGDGKGNFNPGGIMTRGGAFLLLATLDGADVTGATPWYQGAVDWAMDKGYTDGTNPNGNLPREQLITLLWKFEGEPAADTSVLDGFSDSSAIHSYAVDAMAWAVENGIVSGSGSGKLNPRDDANRAMAVTLFMTYCEKFDK